MEVTVALTISDIGEIEREAAHLIPQHPQDHYAGLVGFAYGGIALAVYWLAGAIGLPSIVGAAVALAIAYASGRYDAGRAWKPYNQMFNRLMMERSRNA
jgi:hypothetical protein